MTTARIEVRDLTKIYGSISALRRVSLAIPEGEIFGLLGPNGAGKTTLLETILGLRRADSGDIRIGEIDAVLHPEKVKPFIGAQLQGAALQDKITPREALALFASFYEEPSSVENLLHRFSLRSFAGRPFGTLSSGQKQRVFLALAFVNRPRVVVLDEPTIGLDPAARREFHELIRDAREAGRAVVLSTHDLEEAQHLCDRVGILDRGQLVAVGTPAELLSRAGLHPTVLARCGKPLDPKEMALLPGVTRVAERGGRWSLGTRDTGGTISGLVGLLGGSELLELTVRQPTLEDVYFERTGRSWEPEGGTNGES